MVCVTVASVARACICLGCVLAAEKCTHTHSAPRARLRSLSSASIQCVLGLVDTPQTHFKRACQASKDLGGPTRCARKPPGPIVPSRTLALFGLSPKPPNRHTHTSHEFIISSSHSFSRRLVRQSEHKHIFGGAQRRGPNSFASAAPHALAQRSQERRAEQERVYSTYRGVSRP